MPADVIELLPRFDPESDKAERRFDGMLDRIRSLQEELARLGPKRAELERHFIENDLVIRSGPRRGQPLSVAGRRRRLHALLRIERSYDRVAAEEERLMNHLAVLQAALDEWELEKNETELPGGEG